MADESEIRSQMIDAIEDAEYPVSGPLELLPALPSGLRTRIESDEFSITPIGLSRIIPQGTMDWPYDSPETLVDDIIDELKDRDAL